jgi:hypothetical protein
MRSRKLTVKTLVLLAIPATLLVGAGGDLDCAQIVPPHEDPYGRTYEEWAEVYWQWALGTPPATNPILDETGEFAGEGQSGPVWLYAHTFGDTSPERTYSIPEGKAIFMPVFNMIFGAAVYDCEPSLPGVPCDVDVLRAAARDNLLAARVLAVTIDGVPVPGIRRYRASSEEPFEITLSEDNILGLPEGTYSPNMSDGYWLMLEPLPPGEHLLRTYVYAPDTPYFGTIEYTVTTHLTVE